MQLTITKHPENASLAETTRTIGEEGGSIGRGGSNAWTLDDPERFLSSRHAEIVHEGGNYFVVDLSTNGTFLNDSQEPIGKGNRVQLNEGDRLIMGDYELSVSLWSPNFDAAGVGPFGEPPSVAEAPPAPDPMPDVADPFASPQNPDPGAGGFSPDPLPSSFLKPEEGELFPNEDVLDPLELLNGGGTAGTQGPDELFGGAPGGADPFDGQPGGSPDPLGGSVNGMPNLFGEPSGEPAFPPVGGAPQDPAAGGTQGYNVDPLSQNFVMPEFQPENPDAQSQPPPGGGMGGGAELIPEDWDPFAPDDGAGGAQAEPPGQGGFQVPHPVPTPPPQQAQPAPPVQPPPQEAQPTPPPVQPPPQQAQPIPPVQPPPQEAQPIPPPVQPPPQQAQPMPPPVQPPPQQAQPMPPPVQPPPQQAQPVPPPVQAPQPAAGAGSAFSSGDAALLEALGIANPGFSEIELKALNAVIGEFVREAVSGLIKVLGSRNSIKNEFRMSVTTIQPVENNPLKFAATVEDAVENMFVKRGKAYKPPVEAVRESFDSIADHQVAILAGMRSAFNSILERFDPEEMQKRFEKQGTGSVIPGMRKSRYWEMYEEYFRELTKDLDDSFQFLFGDEFVQAYEGQLTKLAGARRRNTPR